MAVQISHEISILRMNDEKFMRAALELARQAEQAGDVPVVTLSGLLFCLYRGAKDKT